MDEPIQAYERTGQATDPAFLPASETTPDTDNPPVPDLAALAGLFSLLGSSESASSGEPRRDSAQDSPRHSDADSAAELLRTLRPYLHDTRVLSVERILRLLETARGIRGLLHNFGPLFGDFLGGKN